MDFQLFQKQQQCFLFLGQGKLKDLYDLIESEKALHSDSELLATIIAESQGAEKDVKNAFVAKGFYSPATFAEKLEFSSSYWQWVKSFSPSMINRGGLMLFGEELNDEEFLLADARLFLDAKWAFYSTYLPKVSKQTVFAVLERLTTGRIDSKLFEYAVSIGLPQEVDISDEEFISVFANLAKHSQQETSLRAFLSDRLPKLSTDALQRVVELFNGRDVKRIFFLAFVNAVFPARRNFREAARLILAKEWLLNFPSEHKVHGEYAACLLSSAVSQEDVLYLAQMQFELISSTDHYKAKVLLPHLLSGELVNRVEPVAFMQMLVAAEPMVVTHVLKVIDWERVKQLGALDLVLDLLQNSHEKIYFELDCLSFEIVERMKVQGTLLDTSAYYYFFSRYGYLSQPLDFKRLLDALVATALVGGFERTAEAWGALFDIIRQEGNNCRAERDAIKRLLFSLPLPVELYGRIYSMAVAIIGEEMSVSSCVANHIDYLATPRVLDALAELSGLIPAQPKEEQFKALFRVVDTFVIPAIVRGDSNFVASACKAFCGNSKYSFIEDGLIVARKELLDAGFREAYWASAIANKSGILVSTLSEVDLYRKLKGSMAGARLHLRQDAHNLKSEISTFPEVAEHFLSLGGVIPELKDKSFDYDFCSPVAVRKLAFLVKRCGIRDASPQSLLYLIPTKLVSEKELFKQLFDRLAKFGEGSDDLRWKQDVIKALASDKKVIKGSVGLKGTLLDAVCCQRFKSYQDEREAVTFFKYLVSCGLEPGSAMRMRVPSSSKAMHAALREYCGKKW
jgi:hypothetical protein